MIYPFTCTECHLKFERSLPIARRNEPLSEGCPACDGSVIRSFEGTTVVAGIHDVQTLAKKKQGSAYTEVMSRIQRSAGQGNTVKV